MDQSSSLLSCGSRVRVPPSSPLFAVMSAAPYHLAERGVSVGVWSAAEVEAGLATGRLSPAVLSWREGEPGWIALTARPEFASAIGAFRSLVPPSALAFDATLLLRLDWTTWARTMRACLLYTSDAADE